MGKGKRAGGKSRSDSAPAEAAQPAVLNLTMDSTSEGPREVVAADGAAFKTPCTLVGLGSGLSGGTLGWVFGFGEPGGGPARQRTWAGV